MARRHEHPMGRRHEQRVEMRIPIRCWGMDSEGKMFDVRAHTVDITPVGARVVGLQFLKHPGTVIGVERGRSRSRFRVQWIGKPGTARAGQVGIRCLEPGKYIWGLPLPRYMGDDPYPRRASQPRVLFIPIV